ncbi:MAG: hypothetical protein WAV28_16050 [Sedimentisphaerales bacterium]|jgi:hypothetical protein
MTPTITTTIDIEKSLGELKDAPDISKFGMKTEGTSDFNFGELRNTFVIHSELDDPKKLRLLNKIFEEKSEITSGKVRILMFQKEDTVDIEPWPVVPEFPEPVNGACIEFCDSHGLNPVLRTCLERARHTFSNIKNLYAELDYFRDNEQEDVGHVVIRLEVESDQKTALSQYDAWIDWMVANLSVSESNFFTLTIRRV